MNSSKKLKEKKTLLEEQEETQLKIGARIRQLRNAKKLSQEKFANSYDLDRSQVSRMERGINFEINTLVEYCRALDITIQEFFAGIE